MAKGFRNAGGSDERASRWHGVSRVLVWSVALITCAMIAGACGSEIDQARDLEEQGDWVGALAVYEEMLAEDATDIEALSGAAVALQVLGRFDEALTYQELVVAGDPTDAMTRVELGFNYLNHQDRPADAARVLAEAAELEPTGKNLVFLSQALEATDDLEGAEKSLRKAMFLDPGYGYAYVQLIELLEEQGRVEEAASVRRDAAMRGVSVPD